MKRGKKILVVGLIGLMMAAGLVLAGCNKDCPSNKYCNEINGGCGDNDCDYENGYLPTCDCH